MGARILRELKRDSLGVVELVDGPAGPVVRRVARGGRAPLSGAVARLLLRRERRALRALDGLAGVPREVRDDALAALPGADGRRPRAGEVLLRTWQPGEPLHRAESLPRDFFDLLDALVLDVHRRGVCHNDLHKEQNVVVGLDGRPALIDFQLASVHRRRGRVFASRVHEDLRHVQKHRRRYTRDGRGGDGGGDPHGAGHGRRRTPLAWAWRRLAKPVYAWATRCLGLARDAEERRPSSGPWPRWKDPVGPGSA